MWRILFVKEPQLFYDWILDILDWHISFSITYPMALNLGARFLLGGRIVTPRVFKILKLAMTSYALQSIWTYWKLGYAITKTSLLNVICVELCCLNQVWNTCIVLEIPKTLISIFKFYPKNPFQNLSIFWGWAQK